MTRDRINLSEKEELVKNELKTSEVLNKFFSNIVNNLEFQKIPSSNLSLTILTIKL